MTLMTAVQSETAVMPKSRPKNRNATPVPQHPKNIKTRVNHERAATL